MSVKLNIELTQLAAPGVAEALARLVDALSDPGARPARRAAPARPKPPTIEDDGLSDAERYQAFINQLPDRSRKFIELVRDQKVLRITYAMKALGITAPKAMGGLTGSIGRWAPIRGVKVPYEMTMVEGERAWRWLGSPVDAAEAPSTAAPAPAPPASRAGHTPTMVPAAAPPIFAADEDEPPPEPAQAADPVPEPASAASEPAPEPATDARPAQVDLRAFEGLPKRSQQFITLVAARGIVERSAALEALGLHRPKELGGVTEPIIRRCRELEIEHPFLKGKRSGKRVWIWATNDIPADVTLDG